MNQRRLPGSGSVGGGPVGTGSLISGGTYGRRRGLNGGHGIIEPEHEVNETNSAGWTSRYRKMPWRSPPRPRNQSRKLQFGRAVQTPRQELSSGSGKCLSNPVLGFRPGSP